MSRGKGVQVVVEQHTQAGLGVGPVDVSGRARQAQGLRRLLDGEAGKVAQLNELSSLGVLGSKPVQGVVDGEQFGGVIALDRLNILQRDALTTPAVLVPALAPGLFDEDAAHGLGGSGEEVTATVPA